MLSENYLRGPEALSADHKPDSQRESSSDHGSSSAKHGHPYAARRRCGSARTLAGGSGGEGRLPARPLSRAAVALPPAKPPSPPTPRLAPSLPPPPPLARPFPTAAAGLTEARGYPFPASAAAPRLSPPLAAAGQASAPPRWLDPTQLTGETSRCHQHRHLQGPGTPAMPKHVRPSAGRRAARRRWEDAGPHRRRENAEAPRPLGCADGQPPQPICR